MKTITRKVVPSKRLLKPLSLSNYNRGRTCTEEARRLARNRELARFLHLLVRNLKLPSLVLLVFLQVLSRLFQRLYDHISDPSLELVRLDHRSLTELRCRNWTHRIRLDEIAAVFHVLVDNRPFVHSDHGNLFLQCFSLKTINELNCNCDAF